MRKPFNDVIDLDEYDFHQELPSNDFTELTIVTKKNSPFRKYIFKTFKFSCATSKDQKTILETFYQINCPKFQYLQCYNHYSFLSFKLNWNPTFSMKYISTKTLSDVFKNPELKKKWKSITALNCIFAVTEGVSYLHEHIIFHGNLCPSNIIVDDAEQCYVCDFGLYRIKNLYMPKERITNKYYSAPELDCDNPSEKTDSYSYGILLCQIGIEIFQIEKPDSTEKVTFPEILTKSDKDKYKFLPTFLSEIIEKCLQTNPVKRPSFQEIKNYFHNSKSLFKSSPISTLYDNFLKTSYIENLAKLGNSFALNKLGEMYDEGKGVAKDHTKALEYYKKAALLGNSKAQANYGVSLQEESQTNDADSLNEGAKYLKMSAEQGNIYGMANYGIALLNGDGLEKDPAKADEYLKKSADLGNPYAQVNYGYNLINVDDPTPEQIKQSLVYIKKAIDQGYYDGYYTYGLLLKLGDVIDKNESLALEYFKIAADLGYERAMIEYANANFNANPPNNKMALKYYQMAYEKGINEAKPFIKILNQRLYNNNEKSSSKKNSKSNKNNSNATKSSLNGLDTVIHLKLPESARIPHFDSNTPTEELLRIFKNLKVEFLKLQSIERKLKLNSKDISHYRIFRIEEKFINTNNVLIIYKYGKLYESISNSKTIKEKSLNYYKMAAESGNSKAQFKYGIALQKGRDIKKNAKLGLTYLENSAKQGNVEGMTYFGLALINGEGNKELGLEYLKQAADLNYPVAQLNYGINVDDEKVGHSYIEKAANSNYEKAVFYYATDFMEGRGVEKDFKKAADIFRDLYENEKSIEALINLIECLKKIDKVESIHYLKILADQDDSDYINHIHKAQLRYGLKLFYGDDVPKDEEAAIEYIQKSTLFNKIKSKHPDIFIKMPHDFSPVKDSIESFLNRNNGHVDPYEENIIQSAYDGNIDDMLKTAKMVNKYGDFKTANFFFEMAADSNQMEANYIIGKFYLEGKNGLQVNFTKGNNYIKKAAELGYTEAKYDLILSQMRLVKKNSIDDELFDELFQHICEIADDNYVPAMLLKAKYSIKKDLLIDAKKELGKVLLIEHNDFHVLYKVGKLLLLIDDEDNFALQLIQLSCKKDLKANYFLGKYYFSNKAKSIENAQKAMLYLKKAADNKIKNSQRLLDMYKFEIERYKRDQAKSQQHQFQAEQQDSEIDFLLANNSLSRAEVEKEIQKNPEKIFSIASIIALQRKDDQMNTEIEPKQQQQPKLETEKKKHLKEKPKQEESPDATENEEDEDENFIDLGLPNDALIKKGEKFQANELYIDAFQCFEAVAIRGEPYGYFKCAEVCTDMDKKLQYYQIAIFNNIKGAFRGWRSCIFDYVSKNKDETSAYAQKFYEQNDFSDATILYQKVKDNFNMEKSFQKAVQNIQNIQDGMQQYDFGVFLEQRKEIELAFTMFKKASENGIPQADKKIKDLSRIKMNQLKQLNQTDSFLEQGICYFEGKNGTPIDMNKALSNLTKASDIGCPKADFYLGKYYKKVGNLSESVFYTRKAANAGDPDGQNSYGDYLRLGIGVEKDLNKAIEYYKLSADQGNAFGEFNYGREVLLNPSSQEEKESGIAFLKKAADKPNPDAMYYYSKAIKESNPDESHRYFQASIQGGSEIAIEEYGNQLENDHLLEKAAKLYKSAAENELLIGYKKYSELIIKEDAIDGDDWSLARQYLKKVADLGDVKDQFNYAEFLNQYFQDTDFTVEKALYYKKAAEQGFPTALFRYAECLQNGEGVKEDHKEAKYYYTRSFKEDPNSPTHIILDRLKQQGLIDC